MLSGGKMFGKSEGFPYTAEAPSWIDFRAMMCNDYRQAKPLVTGLHLCELYSSHLLQGISLQRNDV